MAFSLGYFERPLPGERGLVRASALKSGKTACKVLIQCDLIGLSESDCRQIRDQVNDEVPKSSVLISCNDLLSKNEISEQGRQSLIRLVSKTALNALERLTPVKVRYLPTNDESGLLVQFQRIEGGHYCAWLLLQENMNNESAIYEQVVNDSVCGVMLFPMIGDPNIIDSKWYDDPIFDLAFEHLDFSNGRQETTAFLRIEDLILLGLKGKNTPERSAWVDQYRKENAHADIVPVQFTGLFNRRPKNKY